MDQAARKDHSDVIKIYAMGPKGEGCSREVKIDGQKSQMRNSEASAARRKRHI